MNEKELKSKNSTTVSGRQKQEIQFDFINMKDCNQNFNCLTIQGHHSLHSEESLIPSVNEPKSKRMMFGILELVVGVEPPPTYTVPECSASASTKGGKFAIPTLLAIDDFTALLSLLSNIEVIPLPWTARMTMSFGRLVTTAFVNTPVCKSINITL